MQVDAADETTGCASPIISYPINVVGPDPSDSLTLLYVASPASSALAPPAMPVPGESGSGTVITGQCNSSGGAGLTEVRLTLTGAVPDRTLTMFVTPSGSTAVAVGTVTTDASGNGSFKSYLPHCFANLGSSSTLPRSRSTATRRMGRIQPTAPRS